MTTSPEPHWVAIIERGTPDELRASLKSAVEHARRSSLEVEKYRRAADKANARAASLRRELEWMNERYTVRRILRGLRRRLSSR